MADDEQLTPATDLHETNNDVNDATDVRIERIMEYVDDSLKKDDALQAMVGAVCGDLMLMQYRMRQAIDETLQVPPDSLTAIAEVMPAMNTFMKLGQQVGQFVQLNLKIKGAKDGS